MSSLDTTTYYVLSKIGNKKKVNKFTVNTSHDPFWTDVAIKVWREGPRGGVKIVRDHGMTADYGYITKNTEKMKEFMWIKLAAI